MSPVVLSWEVGASWRKQVMLRDTRTLALPLLPGRQEGSSFVPPHAPATMSCLTTGPKAVGPADQVLKPLRPRVKVDLSSF